MKYIPNIPEENKKRIVIAGAGLKLARKIIGKRFQIILPDRNNFHQFQNSSPVLPDHPTFFL